MKLFTQAASQIVATLERDGQIQRHDNEERAAAIKFLAAQIEDVTNYTFKMSD